MGSEASTHRDFRMSRRGRRRPGSGAAEATPPGVGRDVMRTVPGDAHPVEQLVDLVTVRLTLRSLRKPDEVPGIDPCDLTERPAEVAPEIDDRPRRAAR